MPIDFTDFGLLGSGNGLSIAKKTNVQQILTEDSDGNILRQTVSNIVPVESKITELTPEEFMAVQKEDADSIALSGVYDTEQEQEDAMESAIRETENNSRLATDEEQQDAVVDSILDDASPEPMYAQLTDQEMNDAVIDANLNEMSPQPMYDQLTDQEMNDAVVDSIINEQFEKDKENSYKDSKNAATDEEVRNMVAAAADLISDYRVRLAAPEVMALDIYGPKGNDNILSILHKTNGIVFHYTPNITEQHSTEYKQMSMVSSNQDYYSYSNTGAPVLTVSGKFVSQNMVEAKYAMAVIHFMRTITKSHFGKKDANAGNPPPIMEFSGYGRYMYNKLPVIIRNHNITFKDDVDYIDVYDSKQNKTKIPLEFELSLDLVVQNTPKRWREEFNLDDFRTGKLMRDSNGWL